MRNFFLDRYASFGKELTGREQAKKALRVNSLKISAKELVSRLKNLGVKLEQFSSDGYFFESKFSVGASIEYLVGLFTMQESSAQIPVSVLKPSSKDTVLDIAAAPGGKTIQMADYMKNKGSIISIDNNKSRCYALENNLERCGVENCVVYCADFLKFDFGRKFKKILLDAPCSGNYANDDKWFDKRDIDGIKRNGELQKKMIGKAIDLLDEGGVLVYATCSREPADNEIVIDWALSNYSIKLMKVGDSGLIEVNGQALNKEIKKCLRVWPDEGQGFFIAKIKK